MAINPPSHDDHRNEAVREHPKSKPLKMTTGRKGIQKLAGSLIKSRMANRSKACERKSSLSPRNSSNYNRLLIKLFVITISKGTRLFRGQEKHRFLTWQGRYLAEFFFHLTSAIGHC